MNEGHNFGLVKSALWSDGAAPFRFASALKKYTVGERKPHLTPHM